MTVNAAGSAEQGYRIEVTEDCAFSGTCISLAPKYFTEGDDNCAKPVRETVGEEDKEAVLEAAELCPMGAIRVIDTRTGEDIVDA